MAVNGWAEKFEKAVASAAAKRVDSLSGIDSVEARPIEGRPRAGHGRLHRGAREDAPLEITARHCPRSPRTSRGGYGDASRTRPSLRKRAAIPS